MKQNHSKRRAIFVASVLLCSISFLTSGCTKHTDSYDIPDGVHRSHWVDLGGYDPSMDNSRSWAQDMDVRDNDSGEKKTVP